MRINRRALMLGGALMLGRGAAWAAPDPLTVRTRQGLVRGAWADGVRRFSGIPYTRSTAGEARFAPPEAAAPWAGIHEARDFASCPAQPPKSLAGEVPTAEGPLHINVWAPAELGNYPVCVWIYGGGNTTGCTRLPHYAGDRFARDGVVFVSFDYRVGVFGFLELGGVLGDKERGSGNNALRDQVLALQWVRDNIAAFGGDPDRVTLGGVSAGAKNVCSLLGLPAARGLFRQAIVESGSAQTVHDPATADAFARLFVEKLGGIDRLKTAAMDEVLKAQAAAAGAWTGNFPYRPVVDGRFLPATPLDLLRAGGGRGVATLIGSNGDESRMFVTPEQARGAPTQAMLSHIDAAEVPKLQAAYAAAFPELPPDARMWRLVTAEEYGIPSLRVAEAQAATGTPVYRYRLAYPSPGGSYAGLSPHMLDVPFVFGHLDTKIAALFGLSGADEGFARLVHAAWVSFIRQGTPEPVVADWTRFTQEARHTLLLQETPRLSTDPDEAERRIWDGVL